MLLVPSDPLSPRRPDPHFVDEAAAARDHDCRVALIDHDLLQSGGSADEAVRRIPPDGDAVYRGWMLTANQYRLMSEALTARGVILRTPASTYRQAHELPGWYGLLEGLTPETCWGVGDDPASFLDCCAQLGEGAAVLRDYTKSMKHYWTEAAFIPDVSNQSAALSIARRFRELRESSFDGGYVLRRFEPFTGPEVRSWWVDQACAALTAHPDTPQGVPTPATPPHELGALLADLGERLAGTGLGFVTADLVQLPDRSWRVVEMGDGQVSDRPSSWPAELLIDALSRAGTN